MSLDDDIFGFTPIGESVHAVLGPSSAERWTTCTASPSAQEGLQDHGTEAARWGTANHLLSETCLNDGSHPADHLGRKVLFWIHPESDSRGSSWAEDFEERDGYVNDPNMEFVHEVEIEQEQVDCALTYITYVQDLVRATGGVLYVEQRVPIGFVTGEVGAHGTADAIITVQQRQVMRRLLVVDLKGGMMKVDAFYMQRVVRLDDLFGDPSVEPVFERKPNLQLAMYAIGALEKFGWDNYDVVEMHIVQPRLNHFSEHEMSVAELRELVKWLSERAEATRSNPTFSASYKNCLFCKAKVTCKARQRQVLTDATAGFEDEGEPIKVRQVKDYELGAIYEALDQIEDWCTTMRARVESELSAGRPVIGNKGRYKLVEGRNTARYWTDEKQAETLLTQYCGIPQYAYTQPKLVSPTAVEDLTKKRRGKKQVPILAKELWDQLQFLVKQDKGKPQIALEVDERPAIASPLDGLTDDAGNPGSFDPFN